MDENRKTYLSFQISQDVFAVDALKVDHIMELPSYITSVPNTQDYMKGVVNLHGNIIPVVDMRIIMRIENIVDGEDVSIVVINPEDDQDSRLGLIVDAVREVHEVDKEQLKETIIEGVESAIDAFEGTYSKDGEFVHVIDIKSFIETIE